MSVDVLEKKLHALPETCFEEVSNFLDYILFKFQNETKDDEKVEVVDSKDEDKDVILEPLIDDESEDSQEEITSNENKEKDEEFIPETEKLGPMVDYESIKFIDNKRQ